MDALSTFITNLNLQEVTFAVFGVWGIFAVLTGKLITRSTYETTKAEAESWKKAYEQEQEARRKLQETAELSIQQARTVIKILEALPPAPDDPQGGTE